MRLPIALVLQPQSIEGNYYYSSIITGDDEGGDDYDASSSINDDQATIVATAEFMFNNFYFKAYTTNSLTYPTDKGMMIR